QNRDGFDFRPPFVHSPDFPIDQNQVGWSLRQDERRERERYDKSEKLFHWKQHSFSGTIYVCAQILCRAIPFAKPCAQFFVLTRGCQENYGEARSRTNGQDPKVVPKLPPPTPCRPN